MRSNLSRLYIPAVIGVFAGVIPSLDFLLFNLVVPEEKYIPYLFSAAIFALSAGALALYSRFNAEALWKIRHGIVLFALVAGLQTKGLAPILDPLTLTILATLVIFFLESSGADFKFRLNGVSLLVLAIIISIALSIPMGGARSLFAFLTRAKVFLFIFLISIFLNSRDSVYTFLKALLLVTLASSVYAFFQESLFLTTGIVFPPVSEKDMTNVVQDGFLRVFGLTGIIQEFSLILLVVGSVVFSLLLHGKVDKLGRLGGRKTLLIYFFLPVLFALFLTFSNGAILAFAMTAGLTLLLIKRPFLIHFSVLAVTVILAFWAAGLLPDIYREVEETLFFPGDFSTRVQMWKDSLYFSAIKHPVSGMGVGRSALHVTSLFKWPPHNTFIQAYAEIGLVGTTLYAILHLTVFLKLLKTLFSVESAGEKTVVFSLIMGFISMFIYINLVPFLLTDTVWFFLIFFDRVHENFVRHSYPLEEEGVLRAV